ncbi:hypothetical protein CSOJ01_15928 [Colletotrichum sojae]|uniref:Uncharacterized protein n=1 Tax=Colletotrichum sojae TaxID=2175907 RepID=A0A8H6ILU2_9PEZI|nr:hypothetical protein CSOJ01_15928 [Colletotrichum sojae]
MTCNEETARRAGKNPIADSKMYFDVAEAPLVFLGLMCDSFCVLHRWDCADEAHEVLVNSWAAVKMALFAVEQ